MATEASLPVNGNYGATSHTSSQSASLANGASEQSSAPQTGKDEVGWYFVEQYYTTMSRSPEKVHLFYNKRSQFVYGVEAEKVPVSVGQKAINERIAELGIEDCKVRVTNVDSQESGKSIVLQVIGEMSVKGQPHKKFAQTFVLAEQPNGYFVLNDIFRYIADEPDEDEEELEPALEVQAGESAHQEEPKTFTISGNIAEQAPEVEVIDKKLEEAASVDEPTTQTASIEDPVVIEADSVDEPEEDTSVAEVEAHEVAEVEALEPERPKDPEPTPSISPAPVAQGAPPKAAPAPAAPAKPKSWAAMFASKAAPPAVPIVPSVPVPQAQPKPAPTAPQAAAPSAPAAAAAQAAQAAPVPAQVAAADSEVPPSPGGWQSVGQEHGKKNNRNQGPAVVNGYIKNVTEKISDNALRQHLLQYGKLQYFDVSRPKQCAFIEFENPAGYNAAVAANPHEINGEQIVVEERRPRGNTFGNNFRGGPRGGAGGGGGPGGRGGFPPRGRGGPAGRGRGGAPDA